MRIKILVATLSLFLVTSLICLMTAGAEQPPAALQVTTNGLTLELADAAADAKQGHWADAEKLYCNVISKLQLASGFEDPNWVSVLRQLASVYKAEHKDQDQTAALKLAADITSGAVPKTYVGTVEMLPDSSIVVRKRINAGTIFGDAFIHLNEQQPGHAETCQLVRGLNPGQIKLLPPWPGMDNQHADLNEIGCGMNMVSRQILLVEHSEYSFMSANGAQRVRTDNSASDMTLHGTAHALDVAKHYPSHSQEFTTAILSDAAHFSIPDRIKYGFYLQPRFGTEETYATVYAALMRKRGSPPAPQDKSLIAAFPAVTALITNQEKEIENAQPAKLTGTATPTQPEGLFHKQTRDSSDGARGSTSDQIIRPNQIDQAAGIGNVQSGKNNATSIPPDTNPQINIEFSPDPQTNIWMRNFATGSKLKADGKYAEAEPYLQAAVRTADNGAATNKELANSLNALGGTERYLKKYPQAVAAYQRVLDIFEKDGQSNTANYATVLDNLAQVYSLQGDKIKCGKLQEEAITIYEKTLGPNSPDLGTTICNVGDELRQQGNYAEAEKHYLKAIGIFHHSLPPNDVRLATAYDNLASVYSNTGQLPKAETMQQNALTIFQERLPKAHPDVSICVNNLATTYVREGKYDQAKGLMEKQLAVLKQEYGQSNPEYRRFLALYSHIMDVIMGRQGQLKSRT